MLPLYPEASKSEGPTSKRGCFAFHGPANGSAGTGLMLRISHVVFTLSFISATTGSIEAFSILYRTLYPFGAVILYRLYSTALFRSDCGFQSMISDIPDVSYSTWNTTV